MLSSLRYRPELDAAQSAYADRTAAICRAVWNAALDQRRTAAELDRHPPHQRRWLPNSVSRSREVTEAKATDVWLAEAPRECIQQTLRDLEQACRRHGVRRVHFRSRHKATASFRFSGEAQIGRPRRLDRRWGNSACRSPAGSGSGGLVPWR